MVSRLISAWMKSIWHCVLVWQRFRCKLWQISTYGEGILLYNVHLFLEQVLHARRPENAVQAQRADDQPLHNRMWRAAPAPQQILAKNKNAVVFEHDIDWADTNVDAETSGGFDYFKMREGLCIDISMMEQIEASAVAHYFDDEADWSERRRITLQIRTILIICTLFCTLFYPIVYENGNKLERSNSGKMTLCLETEFSLNLTGTEYLDVCIWWFCKKKCLHLKDKLIWKMCASQMQSLLHWQAKLRCACCAITECPPSHPPARWESVFPPLSPTSPTARPLRTHRGRLRFRHWLARCWCQSYAGHKLRSKFYALPDENRIDVLAVPRPIMSTAAL